MLVLLVLLVLPVLKVILFTLAMNTVGALHTPLVSEIGLYPTLILFTSLNKPPLGLLSRVQRDGTRKVFSSGSLGPSNSGISTDVAVCLASQLIRCFRTNYTYFFGPVSNGVAAPPRHGKMRRELNSLVSFELCVPFAFYFNYLSWLTSSAVICLVPHSIALISRSPPINARFIWIR